MGLVGPVGLVGLSAEDAKANVYFGPVYATVQTPNNPLFSFWLTPPRQQLSAFGLPHPSPLRQQ